MDGCLNVFPMTTWKEIEAKLTSLPITDAQSRNFVRFFYSGATRANTDAAERITLPAGLRTYAGITNTVVIAGAPNRLEIWDSAKWYANLANVETHPPTPDLLRELVG
jgi:MraZ protein